MLSPELMMLWEHDRELAKDNVLVAGVDEVGRGPLAGNVVASCVILNLPEANLPLNDSKKISEKKREALFPQIKNSCLHFGIGECSPEEIDEINILQASFLAMKRAVAQIKVPIGLLLVDGNKIIPGLPIKQMSLVKGDGKSASIAAASILAKVTRDKQMEELHQQYPQYDFQNNKGYGSKKHIKALEEFGFTPYHRKTFKPKALLQTNLFA